VYIIHFPVIQVAVAHGAFARDPWGAFAACVSVTAVLAFASWHVVEKPFLRRQSHYRLAEGARTRAGPNYRSK
jgi:peptidoglycan/LPS O-acetylase OafA/YrhL